jgi:uncharacterized protein (DUF2141 family)
MMFYSRKRLLLVLAPLILLGLLLLQADESTAEQGSVGTLRVQVTGLRNEKGQVRVYLWDRDDHYPNRREKAKVRGAARVTKGSGKAVVTFEALPHGTWAAFIYHDEDGNGELRSNFIGMPKEGVGASKNARGRMGPPDFDDAAFLHNGDPTTIAVKLRYL